MRSVPVLIGKIIGKWTLAMSLNFTYYKHIEQIKIRASQSHTRPSPINVVEWNWCLDTVSPRHAWCMWQLAYEQVTLYDTWFYGDTWWWVDAIRTICAIFWCILCHFMGHARLFSHKIMVYICSRPQKRLGNSPKNILAVSGIFPTR